MRLSIALLLVALAGVVAGAALIGVPAIGGAVIFDSLAVGAWALLREDGVQARPALREAPTVEQVLDRFRGAA